VCRTGPSPGRRWPLEPSAAPQLANGAIGTAQIAPGTVLPAVSIAGTMQAATANTSYLATNAGQTTIGLTDTTANAGDVVTVTGVGAGGWIASLYQPDIWTARESNRDWLSVASSADGNKLVAVEYGGQIYTSTDFGVSWTARESNRSWYSVASSADGSKLVAVVYQGQIYTSTDSGVKLDGAGEQPLMGLPWPPRPMAASWSRGCLGPDRFTPPRTPG
jgi:hypothetical protein